MDFLIFSDSHGNVRGMQEAYRLQGKKPDGVFFLGDGLRDLDRVDFEDTPVYSVAGNCDAAFEILPPNEGVMALCGHTVFYTHGNLYGVKGGNGRILSRAVEVGADIVLFGHTHRPVNEVIPSGTQIGNAVLSKPIYLFNPGSIGRDKLSFGTLLLKENTVLFSHGNL